MRASGLLLCCLAVAFGQSSNSAKSPMTKTEPVTNVLHGVTITDPYRWLEDQNSPATRAWIDEQVRFTQSKLEQLPQRERIRKNLTELFRVDIMNVPIARNGRYFIRKRKASENQSVLYVRQGLTGQDTVLIDPNALSPDHTTSLVMMDTSLDGKLVAYGLRQ